MLDAALGGFAAAGIDGYFIQLCPAAGPPALPGWLAARGWRPIAVPGPSSGATTRRRRRSDGGRHRRGRARSRRDFRSPPARASACRPPCGREPAALGRPPGWHAYVGYDGATPAGAGALYCRGGVAWLGVAATIPAITGAASRVR